MEGKRKIKIGIVGCGAIGASLARAIVRQFAGQAELTAICDSQRQKAQAIKIETAGKAEILPLDKLIDKCDLIIEAASAKISFALAQRALSRCKDVMILSIAGVLDKYEQLAALAKAKRAHLYLPSGALGGLDVIKAAALGKIEKVTLVTRKPPEALVGAPCLIPKKIDLSKLKKETVIFEGNAAQAIKGFPKNVNVCANLSLAGVGAQKTAVRVIAVPQAKTNTHEIQVEGDFGKFTARAENFPSPENPKTSFLAALSAMATLKDILSAARIGT